MKVLLGADGSVHSRLAEEMLLRIPAFKAAEITVVSVAPAIEETFATVGPAAAEQAVQVYDSGVGEAHDIADAAVSRLGEKGVRASAAYLEGDPKREILEFAERSEIDLIAIGSRGMGAIESALLGSVARKLVAHSRCNVLVARTFADEDASESLKRLQTGGKLSIAVGTDGSSGSQIAIDFVKSQGPGTFEKIEVVCAEPLAAIPTGIDPSGIASLYAYDHERAKWIASRTAEELAPFADSITMSTALGRPAQVVSKAAQQEACDLIVVGATRHNVLERFLIGSTSYELATEAPCSVLVVRPPHG